MDVMAASIHLQRYRILLMWMSWSHPSIRDVLLRSCGFYGRVHPLGTIVAFCSFGCHDLVHPLGMSHFAHVDVMAASIHYGCRILLMWIRWSCPPIRNVALCSCGCYGHVHPLRMSHFARVDVMVMCIHLRRSRILLMWRGC